MTVTGDRLVHALLRQHQVGIGVCGTRGRLLMFNPELEALIGPVTRSPSEAWARVYHLFDADGVRPLETEEVPLVRAMAGEVVVDEPITTRRPHEPLRRLCCTAVPMFDGDGAPAGAMVMVTEVLDSSVQQAEDNYRRYRARMRRVLDFTTGLTAVVNHQVRTPLAIIRGHVELLQDEVAHAPDTLRGALPALQRAVESLTTVVEELSQAHDMARATDPTLEAVDLVEVAREAVRRVEASSWSGRLAASYDGPERFPATADPVWVCRAVVALIETVGTSTRDGCVVVRVVGAEGAVMVTVSPDGRAREAASPPRLDAAEDGLPANPRGLGIPLADAVALAHDGTLDVREAHDGITATLLLAREPSPV